MTLPSASATPNEPSPPFEVRIVPPGVIYSVSKVNLMRLHVAKPLCEAIAEAASASGATGLAVNLDAISRATPSAGIYAMRELRRLPLQRIALIGGNPLMQKFAKVVLTLGRFPAFAFFSDAPSAIQWAAGGDN